MFLRYLSLLRQECFWEKTHLIGFIQPQSYVYTFCERFEWPVIILRKRLLGLY